VTNSDTTGSTGAAPTNAWSDWIGRSETSHDTISADRVKSLAATLDVHAPTTGGALPPGWHWIFFAGFVPRSEVGIDGHPKRGGFLPPVPLPRRMWAGGRLDYHSPLIVGKDAHRVSTIASIEAKSGRRGNLVFVTVRHTLSQDDKTCIVEEQDIVYRDPPQPGASPAAAEPAPSDAAIGRDVVPDPVFLFRYSALTYNGHRIHYDRTYAQGEEGYRDLVVHGPLLATLLQGLGQGVRPDARMSSFKFRGVTPVFVDTPFRIEAKAGAVKDELVLWVRDAGGGLAMQASAHMS
jgi:3-methylfumaryl-CoA hydratase